MTIKEHPNHTYTWTCTIDAAYHRDSIRPGFYACIGTAIFLVIFGGILSYQYADWKSFWIVAACAGGFMLISWLVFRLAFSAEAPQESYVLTDTYVRIGDGRSSVFYDFKKIRDVSFHENYIELWEKVRHARIYVGTGEDMEFVKKYITERVKGGFEIH